MNSNRSGRLGFLSIISGLAFLCTPMRGAAAEAPNAPAAVDKSRAQEEIKQGAQAYRAGNYEEAQQHYRSASKLDPSLKSAALLLARSIRAQYEPGIESADNIAKAKEAIATYEVILRSDPNQDEAYAAVVDLYGALKDEAKQRNWISRRAQSEQLPKEKRAAAYRRLTELDSKCARAADVDASAARRCAQGGLESIGKAIDLSADNETAWSLKVQLLHQMAKLAQAQGNAAQKTAYEKQAAQAETKVSQLRERGAKEIGITSHLLSRRTLLALRPARVI